MGEWDGKGKGPKGGKGEQSNQNSAAASEQDGPNAYSVASAASSNPQQQIKKMKPIRSVVKDRGASVIIDWIYSRIVKMGVL